MNANNVKLLKIQPTPLNSLRFLGLNSFKEKCVQNLKGGDAVRLVSCQTEGTRPLAEHGK